MLKKIETPEISPLPLDREIKLDKETERKFLRDFSDIPEETTRKVMETLFTIDGTRESFSKLRERYISALETGEDLLEGESLPLPDNPTEEEKSFLFACLVSCRLFDKIFPFSGTAGQTEETSEDILKKFSQRIREREIWDYLKVAGWTCLSGVRGYELGRTKGERETDSLQEIKIRARGSKSVRIFKSPKGILDIANEKTPTFYIHTLCLGYILEKQTREFKEVGQSDKNNLGAYPALKDSEYLKEYRFKENPPTILLNINELIQVRRKDRGYRPSALDYKLAEDFLRELQSVTKIYVDTGRVDERGEKLFAELPGIIPLVTKDGRIKEAIVILGDYFKTEELGFNKLSLDAIPEDRISELEKRIIIYFSKRAHKDKTTEEIFQEDIFHDCKTGEIPLYKKQGRKRLLGDFQKSMDSIARRGFPFVSWEDKRDGNILIRYK